MDNFFFSGLSSLEFKTLLEYKMQFGIHAGKRIIFVPYEYISWMKKKDIGDMELKKIIEFLCQAHTDGSIDILRESFKKFCLNK